MDPNMLSQILGQGGGPQMPPPPPVAGDTQGSAQDASVGDFTPLLVEALDKMANIGIPFVGDITHLLLLGGGNEQTWQTLIKTIDAYGKHKNSVVANNIPSIQGGPAGGGKPQSMPTQENPQPPGVYS